MIPYLTDAKDRIVFAETPALMQPVYGEPLPPPEFGKHRFVVGHDGLYLEARNAVLELRIKVADSCIPLPYGTVANSGVHLRHGRIPAELLDMAKAKAWEALSNEWAGYVVWDGHRERYDLYEPPIIGSSSAHVSYSNVLPGHLEVVVDVHSHGRFPAFFSDEDDRSDRAGFYIAAVLGDCNQDEPSMACRLVVNGHFLALSLAGIFYNIGRV